MCFTSPKHDEEEYVVPVRLANPTIIKTAATFPVNTVTQSVSAGNNETILLTQRNSRSSQQYIVERRSNSRSPRESNQQIVRVESKRLSPRTSNQQVYRTESTRLSPRTSNQQVVLVESTRLTPQTSPIQPRHSPRILPSPRTSSGRVQFVENEPARVAATMLDPRAERPVPIIHRRSTSQVVVINRTPSQRYNAPAPRISDSVLINAGRSQYSVGQVITPSSPSQRDPRVFEISPRASRTSQISGGVVEIETAGGRNSRRHSTVQAICTDGDPRGSGTWRPVRERHVIIDARGNKTEYYR